MNNGCLIVTCTTGIEDNHLETCVHSASSGMDPADHLEVLQGSSIGMSVFVQFCVTLPTLLIPQLQLWHLHLLVSVQSVDGLYSQMLLSVMFNVLWKCCCNHQNTEASG
jgi:hypothetical protein